MLDKMREGGFGGASEKLAHYSHLARNETPIIRIVRNDDSD